MNPNRKRRTKKVGGGKSGLGPQTLFFPEERKQINWEGRVNQREDPLWDDAGLGGREKAEFIFREPAMLVNPEEKQTFPKEKRNPKEEKLFGRKRVSGKKSKTNRKVGFFLPNSPRRLCWIKVQNNCRGFPE
jgi:hypothetical protein